MGCRRSVSPPRAAGYGLKNLCCIIVVRRDEAANGGWQSSTRGEIGSHVERPHVLSRSAVLSATGLGGVGDSKKRYNRRLSGRAEEGCRLTLPRSRRVNTPLHLLRGTTVYLTKHRNRLGRAPS